MLDVDPSQLESAVADLQSQLRDGLVAADILDLTTGTVSYTHLTLPTNREV